MIMMFTAMPLSLNTIVYPAANGQDTTIGASLALVSNIVGLLTVPLILSLVL
jgi:predicted permease